MSLNIVDTRLVHVFCPTKAQRAQSNCYFLQVQISWPLTICFTALWSICLYRPVQTSRGQNYFQYY